MRFCTITLGCKVNQYESQAIESILNNRDHVTSVLGKGCDVCILNTCAVTAESARKSRHAVRRMKKLEPEALIAVFGCYSELEPESIENLGADIISGTRDRQGFAAEVERLFFQKDVTKHTAKDATKHTAKDTQKCLNENTRQHVPENAEKDTRQHAINHSPLASQNIFEELPPGSTSSRTRALLKIQDGCDNFCTYCIVPYIRGRSRSLPLERVAQYAKQLDEQGYKEIVITGIEISSYGKDLERKSNIISLNNTENGIENYIGNDSDIEQQIILITALMVIQASAPSVRLRLGSLDPALLTGDFCYKLSEIPMLCNHFHLSLQSGCDETLSRMGRKYKTNQVLHTIKTLRRISNDCGITADLITGFPGETDEEFEKTLKFIKKAAFSSMHIFPYSLRPGTKAAKMPDQIDTVIRKERARRATEIAEAIEKDFKTAQIGKTVEVLFEQEKSGLYTGHSKNYLEISINEKVEKNSIHMVKIKTINNGILTGALV